MSERPVNPKPESLDDIIGRRAVVLADQIQKAAAWAKSEMDLQVEVAGALKEFAREAKIKLDAHHNITVATGRPDSVYSNVIVEYKDPGSLSGNRDAANNKKLIEQIRQRFYDMRREENRPMNSMFGVGTDGKYFVFVRFRDEKWTDEEPLEVNRHSTLRFLWALYNLGQKGKPYQPEYLHGDFGSDSLIAQEGVRTLYDEILKTENPKAQVFFDQWKILFGEVCGYDVENLSDKLKKLAEFYGVKGKPHPGQLLFALHTYYALLIKLLAAEIVSFFNPWMTRQVEKLQNATTPAKLRRELEELEQGGIFHTMGITNFLEGDLFAWYLPVWSEPIEKLVRQMVRKLDDYNPGTFSENPAQSRDLLKKLYQQLFPKSVRHDLGEYYTPDWLAEHVLNELGYEGDPDKRILDPACGSGTFLVMAINRIRRWYDANREKCSYGEGELLRKILANVIGFDLNPLAVMAARTNYLVAIKDLIRHVESVEIPVYLCDSIMTPVQVGSQKAQRSFLAETGTQYDPSNPPIAVKTAVGIFLVPPEIATSREQIGKYAEVLEKCIKSGYTEKEFLEQCREEELVVGPPDAHSSLYSDLARLDKENKNGIWARIIKNNFAPLFVGKVDYIAGNPPWVNWESLPEDYRDSMKPLWQQYGLFSLSGSAGRLGGGKKDLSMLFVYTSADHFLRTHARLGFVITQTVFKSRGAGDGFRHFAFSSKGKSIVLRPLVVHDLSRMQVFEGATNATAVFICQKEEVNFEYPVPYVMWSGPSRIDQDENLPRVIQSTARSNLSAIPIESSKVSAPWLTAPKRALVGIQKVMGKSAYKAYAGCCTWMNGVYWVRIVNPGHHDEMLIENLFDIGKIRVDRVTTSIEKDLLYPLLRGRDVKRWSCNPSAYIILAQDPATRAGIPESRMKKEQPKTYAYFKNFEKQLRQRSGFRRYFDVTDPFYSVYNVGPYSVRPIKVFWRQFIPELRMVVLRPRKDAHLGNKVCLTQHVVSFVPFETDEEALYFSGCGNSSPATLLHWNSSTSKSYGQPHILETIRIPRYDAGNKNHTRIRDLASRCHEAAARNDFEEVAAIEEEIDKEAVKLWSISRDELEDIRETLDEARRRGRSELDEEEDDD